MKQIICRQRGCAIENAEEVPLLCPTCGNPIIAEDCLDVAPPPPPPESSEGESEQAAPRRRAR